MHYLNSLTVGRMRTRMWLPLLALGLALLAPASLALGAGDPTGCDDRAPSGWVRTINWVTGQQWAPARSGPWHTGTTVSVTESELANGFCTSRGAGEAYQDGVRWWGSFRQDVGSFGRNAPNPEPAGQQRFERDTWWDGWDRPAIAGFRVAGTWMRSLGPAIGEELVFVAGDSEVWTEIGSFAAEARCMSSSGPLVLVTFTAHNADSSWSASSGGTHWSVSSAAGPGPWTVTAAGFGWSASASLADGAAHTFVVGGCGSAAGGVAVEAHCGDASGPLAVAAAFDAWEERYWSAGGWYGSSGSGASAIFAVPAGASTPLHVRVWWPDGTQADATATLGGVTRFVTTDQALCSIGSGALPAAPVPTTQGPCTDGAGPYDGSWIEVKELASGATGRLYERADGTELRPPTGAPNMVDVAPGTPLTLQLIYHLNGMHFSPDHDGLSRANWGLKDVTGGQSAPLVEVITTDQKELANSAGVIIVPGYSTKVDHLVAKPQVHVGGSGMWRLWQPSWGNWSDPRAVPQLNGFYYETVGATTLTFTPENGHSYELWSMAAHGACQIASNERWSRLQLNARRLDLTLIEVGLDGVSRGPLAHQGLLYAQYGAAGEWVAAGAETDAGGHASFELSQGRRASLIPGFAGYAPDAVALPGWVLWKADSDCAGATVDHAGRYKGIWDIAGPCSVTLSYARVPTIMAAARAGSTGEALAGVEISLADAFGAVLRSQATDSAGTAAFTFSEDELRPLIGAGAAAWRIQAAATAPSGLRIHHAIAGSGGMVRSSTAITVSPVASGGGHTFVYAAPTRALVISGAVRTAASAPDPDRPVGGADIAVTARDAAGAVVATVASQTDASGHYTASLPELPDGGALTVDVVLARWSASTYPDYAPNQSYPGTISPSGAGTATRVDSQTIRLALASASGDVSAAGNSFDLTNQIPAPKPPSAVRWQLAVHSRYDGANVYISDGDQITWPEGETLNWMPYVTLTSAPDETLGGRTYRFDATVVAWSYVGSRGQAATEADSLGRSGCRARQTPGWDGADPALLAGCAYGYAAGPDSEPLTAESLSGQAHSLWSMRLPPDLEPWTYAQQLARLTRVDLRAQVLVRVQTVQLADAGAQTPEQPVGEPLYLALDNPGPYYVNLVAPRSTR